MPLLIGVDTRCPASSGSYRDTGASESVRSGLRGDPEPVGDLRERVSGAYSSAASLRNVSPGQGLLLAALSEPTSSRSFTPSRRCVVAGGLSSVAVRDSAGDRAGGSGDSFDVVEAPGLAEDRFLWGVEASRLT